MFTIHSDKYEQENFSKDKTGETSMMNLIYAPFNIDYQYMIYYQYVSTLLPSSLSDPSQTPHPP